MRLFEPFDWHDPADTTTYCINPYCKGDHLVISIDDEGMVATFTPGICHEPCP